MIGIWISLIGLTCVPILAEVALSKVDPSLLNFLNNFEGYIRLLELHPSLYFKHPVDAVRDYLLAEEKFLQWNLIDFRDQMFSIPCAQMDKLYKQNKNYFDDLPTVSADWDENLLCGVAVVAKDCILYRDEKFRHKVDTDVLSPLMEIMARVEQEERSLYSHLGLSE